MLKTDVNNRNETAVTDERLGQERAQLEEMTGRHTRSPPPPTLGLCSLAEALGGQLGTQWSRLHRRGEAPGVREPREPQLGRCCVAQGGRSAGFPVFPLAVPGPRVSQVFQP